MMKIYDLCVKTSHLLADLDDTIQFDLLKMDNVQYQELEKTRYREIVKEIRERLTRTEFRDLVEHEVCLTYENIIDNISELVKLAKQYDYAYSLAKKADDEEQKKHDREFYKYICQKIGELYMAKF